ncbi:MAG: hypothetical protein WCC84_08225 [Candidatus Cybelea sp.]
MVEKTFHWFFFHKAGDVTCGNEAKTKNAATKAKRFNIAESSDAPKLGDPRIFYSVGSQFTTAASQFFAGLVHLARHGTRVRSFDQSQLCSDEGPPIGDVSLQPWVEAAFEIVSWVLRGN